jgi:hypothetical protein
MWPCYDWGRPLPVTVRKHTRATAQARRCRKRHTHTHTHTQRHRHRHTHTAGTGKRPFVAVKSAALGVPFHFQPGAKPLPAFRHRAPGFGTVHDSRPQIPRRNPLSKHFPRRLQCVCVTDSRECVAGMDTERDVDVDTAKRRRSRSRMLGPDYGLYITHINPICLQDLTSIHPSFLPSCHTPPLNGHLWPAVRSPPTHSSRTPLLSSFDHPVSRAFEEAHSNTLQWIPGPKTRPATPSQYSTRDRFSSNGFGS